MTKYYTMKQKTLLFVIAIAVASPPLFHAFTFSLEVLRQSAKMQIICPRSSIGSPSRMMLPPRVGRVRRWQQHRAMTPESKLYLVNTSPNSSDQGKDKIQDIRPYLTQLFLTCRPSNFPVVTLFHILGVYQAVQLWQTASFVSGTPATSPLLLSLLLHPSIILVLISLLLVTSTSMITNDYYDARSGVDSTNDDVQNENEHYHPLAQGEVPLAIAKKFASYLYAILLLSSAFVPGSISRLMVLGGAIITFLYTVHLKPLTWIKNLSCAALVSMSPVTSGLAAWYVLCNNRTFSGVQSISPPPFHRIFNSPLSFLVVALFAGIMSREILMDITDYEGDDQAGILTVPVKHGKKYASGVALACSFISTIAACSASVIPWVKTLVARGESLDKCITMSSLVSILMTQDTRKVILSVAGSAMLLLRSFSVWKTYGEDLNLSERAIRESLLSVLLVLASFL